MNDFVLAVVRAVLSRLVPDGVDREAVLGDVEEEHAERLARDGRRRADRWLLRQSFRSSGWFLWHRATGDAAWRSAVAVASGWLAAAGTFVTLVAASLWVFRALNTAADVRLLTWLGVAFVSAAAGGRATRRRTRVSRSGAPFVLALLLALSIGAIFLVSPEHEALPVFLVWSSILGVGVSVGATGGPRGEISR